jgi:hypothetical protein
MSGDKAAPKLGTCYHVHQYPHTRNPKCVDWKPVADPAPAAPSIDKCRDRWTDDGQVFLCQKPPKHEGPHESGEWEWWGPMEAQGERCPNCPHPKHPGVCSAQIMDGVFCYCGVCEPATAAPSEERCQKWLDHLTAFLADDSGLTDADVCEELRESGIDPDAVAEDLRKILAKVAPANAGHPSQEGPPAPSCTVCGVPMRKTWACSEHGGPIESGASEPHTAAGGNVTDDQIKYMVNRFLAWKLPENFNPDGGISFKRIGNEHRPEWSYKNEPVGTNLLDAVQAEEMIRYLVDGMDAVACRNPNHALVDGSASPHEIGPSCMVEAGVGGREESPWREIVNGLPAIGSSALVFTNEGHIELGWRIDEDNFQLERTAPCDETISFRFRDGQITHWMKLPEPPLAGLLEQKEKKG